MTFSQFMARVWERKVPFFAVFFVVMTLTYGVLYALDFYPEPVTETATEATLDEETEDPSAIAAVVDVVEPVVLSPLPVSITFDRFDKTIKVSNPESNAIPVLDEALLSGVVRHPDSADFSSDGNIFILGHSSYLPNVLNKNYQAFNNIQKLTWGDKIRVQSADTEYVYRVERVYEAKVSDIFVPNTPGEARLTLATCDVLGAKEDRFIVEAVLIGSYALGETDALAV